MRHKEAYLSCAMIALIGLLAGVAPGRAADVRIGPRRALLVQDKPFFPLFMWLQPVRLIEFHKGLGINTLMGEGASGESAREFLDALRAAGMWGVISLSEENLALKDHPALLTWMYGDEPDLPGQTPFRRPSMDGETVFVEAEKPVESNFPKGSWLVKEHKQLSGAHWLTASMDDLPTAPLWARYRVNVPRTATYVLWDRGMTKAYTSPTDWRFDDGPWRSSPRSLRPVEERKVGKNQSVGWHRYGEVGLTAGEHRFEIRVQEGRTLGAPDKIGTDLLVGLDLFMLTTSKATPSTPFEIVARTPPEQLASLYARKRRMDPSRPVYLNLTARFYEPYRKMGPARPGIYRAYCAATDIVGFDHYPIQGWNRPDRIAEIAGATAALRQIAGKKQPVWVILETTNGSQWTPDDARPPFPYEIRAEVWMAIINGATGIGYFPHVWKPRYSQCSIPAANQQEIKRINAQITRLTPVILGPEVEGITCKSEGKLPVQVMGRRGPDGTLYVFAVNLLRDVREAEFVVPGLKAGTEVTVVDEGKKFRADDGGFTDTFGELAVHIYAIK